MAGTFNQTQVAGVFDAEEAGATGDLDTVIDALVFTSTPQALNAFDSASGEIYASLASDGLDDQIQRIDRLTVRSHENSREGLVVWSEINRRGSEVNSDGNGASLDQNSFGVNFGTDYRAKDNHWAAGAAAGYFEGDLDDGRNSNTDVEGWHAGAYGRYGTSGAGITATAAAGYSDTDVDVARTITIGSLSRTATGETDVDTFAVAGELRYGVKVAEGLSAGPVGSVRYADSDLGSFAETGADSLNLNSNGGGDSRTRYGIGGFANWQVDKGAIDASVQYVDGSSNFAEIGVAFSGAIDTPFAVRSAETNGSGGLFSVSGKYELTEGLNVNGSVRGFYSNDQQSTAASVGLGWKF